MGECMGTKHLLSKSKEGGREGGNRPEQGSPSMPGELSHGQHMPETPDRSIICARSERKALGSREPLPGGLAKSQ